MEICKNNFCFYYYYTFLVNICSTFFFTNALQFKVLENEFKQEILKLFAFEQNIIFSTLNFTGKSNKKSVTQKTNQKNIIYITMILEIKNWFYKSSMTWSIFSYHKYKVKKRNILPTKL